MVLDRQGPVESSPLRLRDVPAPTPGPCDVLVKVHVCGICRTDLHVIEGELPEATLPLIPGHQTVGMVERLGSGVRSLKEGDRVGIAWLRQTCGACEFCRSGRENLCRQAQFSGYHVNGGYADYAVVPESFAYPLPATFTDQEAAPLLCAGIIGYRALRLSGVRPGQRLGLYGFGASAHIAIQMARAWGCAVYVCSLREEHRRLARELGAAWVGGSMDSPPELLHGAILFAPAGELIPPALRALERGGALAVAGIHLSTIPPLDYQCHLFGERVLRSVTANTRQDGLDLLREAAAIPIRPRTQAYPLEEANRALHELKKGTIAGAGVLTVNAEG